MSLLVEYSAHEPQTCFFKWDAATKGFGNLNGSVDYLVTAPTTNGVDNWQHQPIVKDFYGRKWLAHNTAPYDEGQSGTIPLLHVSDDQGKTWTEVGYLLVPQSDPTVRVSAGTLGRIAMISKFLVLDEELYAFVDVHDQIKIGTDPAQRVSIGHLVIKIDSDATINTPVWIHNSLPAESAPAAFSGSYPSYLYDSALAPRVKALISAPNFYPKLMFGWPEVWKTSLYLFGEILGEPQSIKPRGYRTYRKHYKIKGQVYGRCQYNGDGYPSASNIPESSNSGVTRFAVYDNKTIIVVGNTAEANREEGFVAIARQDPLSKKFVVAASDVYSVTSIQKDTTDWPGDGKAGGEQLFGIQVTKEGFLDIVFSVTKEDIYFKTVDLRSLI